MGADLCCERGDGPEAMTTPDVPELDDSVFSGRDEHVSVLEEQHSGHEALVTAQPHHASLRNL